MLEVQTVHRYHVLTVRTHNPPEGWYLQPRPCEKGKSDPAPSICGSELLETELKAGILCKAIECGSGE